MSCRILIVVLAAIALGPSSAFGQSRQIIDYTYDDAGNIIGIESTVSDGPPSIGAVSPAAVRIGPKTTVIVTGTNLRLSEVSASEPSVVLSGVRSNGTSVTFEIEAPETTPLGPVTLTFSTRQGIGTAQLEIRPRLPIIVVSPRPLSVGDGGGQTLDVVLSNPDIVAHPLTLSVTDEGVATVSTTALNIPAGATRGSAVVSMNGVSIGQTNLQVSSPLLNPVSVNVFVTSLFVPPPGDNAFFSQPVGIVFEGIDGSTVFTRGPITRQVGVFKTESDPPPTVTDTFLASTQVGIARDGLFSDVSPNSFIPGQGPRSVTVTGSGLDAITGVAIVPPDDIAISGLVPAGDGNSAVFSVDVAVGAALGERRMLLNTASGAIPPLIPTLDRIFIAADIPRVVSINPILVLRGETISRFSVRGTTLGPVESVDISPSEGLTIGEATVNASGTEVTFGLEVSETAIPGSRVVTVSTRAGTSDATSLSANTLALENGPALSIPNVLGPLVGVVREPAQAPSPIPSILNVSPAVGVTSGPAITAIAPPFGFVGTITTIVLSGTELEAVDAVEFVPADGLTIGPPVVSPDGLSVQMQVTIASGAATVLREVRLLAAGVPIPPSRALDNRFLITGP